MRGWSKGKPVLAVVGAVSSMLIVAGCTTAATNGGTATGDGGLLGRLVPDTTRSAGASLGYGAATFGSGSQEGLWVNGVGKVALKPDVALLRLGIEIQRDSVEAARNEAAAAMNRVIEALKALGIESRDIQTSFFNIQPVYHYEEVFSPQGGRTNKQVLDGYQVTNQLSVRVRALDKVGQAIDGGASAGGDAIRIQGVSFTVQDPEGPQAEARTKAVKDAVSRARSMAEAAGVKLGRLVYLSESGGGSPVPMARAEGAFALADKAAPTPVEIGELEVTVQVQAVFALE
ncbi:MAG: SIMPL domain-containing protein [Chloroflexi bacterium]|nr:SIMPL domain-containing protein [Chloroflexota bacterium]